MDEESSSGSTFKVLLWGSGTPTDRKNMRAVNLWSVAWAVSLMGSAAVVGFIDTGPILSWLIVLFPSIVALGMLRSYIRLLRMTDEMQRRIHVEGLATGFGITYIFAVGYTAAQGAGAPELNPAALVVLMTLGWMMGTYTAVRRYQ